MPDEMPYLVHEQPYPAIPGLYTCAICGRQRDGSANDRMTLVSIYDYEHICLKNDSLPICCDCKNKTGDYGYFLYPCQICRHLDTSLKTIQSHRDPKPLKVCLSCARYRHYRFTCPNCSTFTPTEICPTCGIEPLIFSYTHHTQPHQIPYFLAAAGGQIYTQLDPEPSTRYFGIELEANYQITDRRTESSLTKALYTRLECTGETTPTGFLKSDGSIGVGAEIVLFPATFEALHALITKMFNYQPATPDQPADWDRIPGIAAYRSGRCGMHIHVSRSSLTPQQIKKAIVFLNAPENNQFIQTVAQRGNTTYSTVKPGKTPMSRTLLNSHDRYEILNVCNPHTVEIRAFRASFRPDRILKNIQFTEALFNFVPTVKYADLTEPKFRHSLDRHKEKYPELYQFIQERMTASPDPTMDDENPTSTMPPLEPPTMRGRAPRSTATPEPDPEWSDNEPTDPEPESSDQSLEDCTCDSCLQHRRELRQTD